MGAAGPEPPAAPLAGLRPRDPRGQRDPAPRAGHAARSRAADRRPRAARWARRRRLRPRRGPPAPGHPRDAPGGLRPRLHRGGPVLPAPAQHLGPAAVASRLDLRREHPPAQRLTVAGGEALSRRGPRPRPCPARPSARSSRGRSRGRARPLPRWRRAPSGFRRDRGSPPSRPCRC